MDIQLLSFNDFHGNLEPPAGSSGRIITSDTYTETSATNPTTGVITYTATPQTVNAGGVEYLAGPPQGPAQGHQYTATVAAATSSAPRRSCRRPSTTSPASRP